LEQHNSRQAATIAMLTAAKAASETSVRKLHDQRDASAEKVRVLEEVLAKATAYLPQRLRTVRAEVIDLQQGLSAKQAELADSQLAERQRVATQGQADGRLRQIRALISTNVASPARPAA
jgi:hypothetical protein